MHKHALDNNHDRAGDHCPSGSAEIALWNHLGETHLDKHQKFIRLGSGSPGLRKSCYIHTHVHSKALACLATV